MEQVYYDLVDYSLCEIDCEELFYLTDKKYDKLIKEIVNDLFFDSEFNDYIDARIEKHLKEELKKMKESGEC